MSHSPKNSVQDYGAKEFAYFGNPRHEILPLLPGKISSLLEIGAGDGSTISLVKQNKSVKTAVAVELFEDAARQAAKHADAVVNGNIEEMEPGVIPHAPFDLILCLDVLEHLVDPWTAVRKLTSLLTPEGRIVASLPNVSHFSASLPLFFLGRWTLEDDGILDRTHLRFFVKQSAIELMTCSGLRLRDVRASNLHRGAKAGLLNRLTLGLFERFLAIQYLVTVESPPPTEGDR